MQTIKMLGIGVLILGVIGVIIGGIFVGLGISKNNLIVDRMRVEKVTLPLDPDRPDVATQIDNSSEAQKAADTIASHRRAIAPTYQDLLGGKQFDPTDPKQLSYAQAMNLENYLYMAVTAFGLIDVAMASGAFMILSGLAVALVGFALYKLGKIYQIEH